LAHEEYAHLRETASLLCPVKEESYALLDDLYSEVCPRLPFEFFNVCCDETWGLGTGPSKELADEIGVGGVYVRHMRRVHDLLKEKYQKRMMMWGDIILQHPEHLDQIPKDTIMLTWGYSPRDSFEEQIIPFANSGYEFFVCPGISNWSRILPDFGVATTNIRNFVRDGAKHGAIGMLNTAWEDDGDALQGYKWHGYAWGAECAWNASTTTPDEFNRRIGAVLFGEQGDHFGRAIQLLSQTHQMTGMQRMLNRRFWEDDFQPTRSPDTIRKSSHRLLAVVRPAIEHLQACREEATLNAELLDAFLLGARRMERIGQRMLDGLEAARLYTQACDAPPQEALPLLSQVESLVENNRDAHETLAAEFKRIWLAESKPYAVDWTLDRYAATIKRYNDLAGRLAEARKKAASGQALPRPEELGLLVPESFGRRARPFDTVDLPLDPDAPWADPAATHRVGVVVRAGSVERFELPMAVSLPLSGELAAKPVRAFLAQASPETPPREILAQLDPSDKSNRTRLTVIIPGPLAKKAETLVHVYLGLPKTPEPLPQAVTTADAPDGMKWIENDKVRLLLGPEGGHVYRWEVKGLENRDLTVPGQTGWAGFADVHAHRSTPHRLKCVARGPALVRYECTTDDGLVKSIGLFGGASWMEIVLNEPVGSYWNFDNPANFAAGGPSPGAYLFSNGATGPVAAEGHFAQTQVKARGVYWAVKSNPDRLALGLVTPEVAAHHVIGPGSGSGGVGVENSPPVGHFVTYAGLLDAPPSETMTRLCQTLDFRNQPQVILHAIQPRN
ncbi:MAG: family 20 glycosylhydrolase, partial [Planctomycetes bacterium]|nr:family 20 glycosylhydrolase [Planctomycetota bacterium]